MGNKVSKHLGDLTEVGSVHGEESPYEVPRNWLFVNLGTVVDFFSGAAFPKSYQGHMDKEIPFFKVGNLKDVDNNYYLNKTANTISEEERIKMKAKLVPRDTILFAKIGEAIKLNRRAMLTNESCIDNNLMGVRPKSPLLDSKYLLYWSLKEDFYQLSQATAIPSIRKSTLEKVKFPLPPLQEQKRIVEKLEKNLGKIKEARKLIVDSKKTFEFRQAAIIKSTLNETFDKDYIPQGWESIPIKKLFRTFGGGTPSKSNPDYWNGDIPWISAKDMKTSFINNTQDYITEEGLNNSSAKLAEKSAVVMVVRSGILQRTLPVAYLLTSCTVNQDLKVFDSGDEFINKYFMYYVKGNESKLLYQYSKSGTTVNSIDFEKFKNHEILLPPIEIVKSKVNRIESLLKKDEKAFSHLNSLEMVENLKKSVLFKAFRGELGTNNSLEKTSLELLSSDVSRQ
ncbi:restriction endonuclease subunit S [Rossellomorea aquimaris]|uniref:restriction endonuclease subunit S n=1 Tax=Rossellomorea TaxID=2837508 RepID=UPI0021CC620E|nr:restriction endonuclease subunit S [Rossellomorea aquimaris]